MYSSFGSLGGQGNEGGFGFIATAKRLSEGDQLRADLGTEDACRPFLAVSLTDPKQGD